jgi:3-hydroxy-D-aspartate aldolase
VASQIVTPAKNRRLCALARFNRITVAVDNPQNVDTLSRLASESQDTLNVLVEVDAGAGRCGVSPGKDALDLAKVIHRSPGLEFRGLMSNEGRLFYEDKEKLEVETRQRLQPVLDTRQLIEGEGIAVPTVSVGSTSNYDVAGQMSGITEIQAGSYPLMDYNYCQYRTEFSPAVRILASIISHPVEARAVVDSGHKATGPDLGLPVLEGVSGAKATRFSAEHWILELDQEAFNRLRPNEKVWLVPFDLSLCVNQYDYFRVARAGKLEGFWPVAARGRWD